MKSRPTANVPGLRPPFFPAMFLLSVLAGGARGHGEPAPVAGPQAYACVPAAGALVLTHFDRPADYAELVREMGPRPDGSASLGSLVRVCERRGLHSAAYSDLSLSQVQAYLRNGFAVVIVVETDRRQHAISLFGAGDKILGTDLLQPMREANLERLGDTLAGGAPCVIFGSEGVPSPEGSGGPGLWLATLAGAGLVVLFVPRLFRRASAQPA